MSNKSSEKRQGAFFVAAGILFSRISGLIRMRVMAHFFGSSDAGDAFYAAIKIPNFPQNLLGEGVLSASFIPVYAAHLAQGDQKKADQVASAIFSLLFMVTSLICGFGILFSSQLVSWIAPGFEGEKRELTVQLVQIIFPGTGLLVLSAWCLGVLNSHRRFFLSYVAPVIWNLSVIVFLIIFRDRNQFELARWAAWGLTTGSLLQLLIQWPSVLKLMGCFEWRWNVLSWTRISSVQQILKNFIPVVMGRGVVQLSTFVDSVLASFLPSGAVAAIGYAQSIYMLPISLFGMSVSAAELPAMSAEFGAKDLIEKLKSRIFSARRKMTLFVVPSVFGILLMGDIVAQFLYGTGKFDQDTGDYVWKVLAGYGIGLLATTWSRLYSSAFYSLRDTKTPLRFSLVRVILGSGVGMVAALYLPNLLGLSADWGTTGLTAAAGLAGWVEYFLLKASLEKKLGPVPSDHRFLIKVLVSAILAVTPVLIFKDILAQKIETIWLKEGSLILMFAMFYFIFCTLLNVPGLQELRQKLTKKF